MEKSSARRHRKFRIRLLTLCFFLCTFFASYASAISWEAVQSLRFRKTEKYFFTVTECPFVLDIENVSPEKVSVFVNDVPSNVSFMSAKKETYIPSVTSKNIQTGTRLLLYFRFEKPGDYQIKPVDVRIDGLYCRIPLEAVSVYENPNLIKPELSVQFTSPTSLLRAGKNLTLTLGEHLHFTLYIRYAVQVVHFSWDIPEDSLFIEQKRYEITERSPRGMDFSPESVPIASFDWEPLKSGSYKMPNFYITATSYSGIKYTVSLPDFSLTVNEQSDFVAKNQNTPEENIFSKAFISTQEENSKTFEKPTQEDLKTLVALHKKERKSFPLFNKKIVQERKNFEASFGIIPQKEKNIPLFILCGLLSLLFFAGSILGAVFKKKKSALCVFFCGFFLAAIFVFLGIGVSKKTAVFCTEGFRSIPEESIEPTTSIQAGSTIILERKAGSWYLARFYESLGWVNKNEVLLINERW